MGQIAKVLVQLRQLRLEVGEAADHGVAVLGPDEDEHLLAQEPNVLGQGVDLLQRAIVEVEPEPHEQPLVRLRESGLGGPRLEVLRRCAHPGARPIRW